MKNASFLIDDVSIFVADMNNPPPEVLHAFEQCKTLYCDTETTGFDPWHGELALIQAYDPESKIVFIGRCSQGFVSPEWWNDLFQPYRTFVGHNWAQFDLIFMHYAGVPWQRARHYDTLIAETIISTSGRADVKKSLQASVRRRVGLQVDKDIVDHGNWRRENLSQEQLQYAATDVLVLPELVAAQLERARDTKQEDAINMEMAVAPMFTLMNINGLPIDVPTLDSYLNIQRDKMQAGRQLLADTFGDINVNSPVQLRKALNEFGIAIESTAKDQLAEIISFDPDSTNAKLLQAILDVRSPSKRISMYGSEQWRSEHIMSDSRVHARFWQVGADTTRVSSSDPNLQQIPKDGRYVFGHVAGHKIVSVDYSQIEVRIAAAISNDTHLIELLELEDIHKAIASAAFKVAIADVTPKQRKLAKAMVFTLLFGGSPNRFYEYARNNGSDITFEEACEYYHAFFESFQGLWQMRLSAKRKCASSSAVTIRLPNGAKRVLFGQKLTPANLLNTPVQGTAAVGMKLGLIRAYNAGLGKYIGAAVHDEAVACVPEHEAMDYAIEMQRCLVDGMREIITTCKIKAEIALNKDGSLPSHWLM